jgi:glycosidase
MQWDSSTNAGFTTNEKPWFSINPNYVDINVENAKNDENSILNFYKELLKLRKTHKAIIYGSFHLYYKKDKKLFVYEKRHENERVFVVVNVSEEFTKIKVPKEVNLNDFTLILSNYQENGETLKPYECRIYSIKE